MKKGLVGCLVVLAGPAHRARNVLGRECGAGFLQSGIRCLFRPVAPATDRTRERTLCAELLGRLLSRGGRQSGPRTTPERARMGQELFVQGDL